MKKTGEALVGRGVHVEFLNGKADVLQRPENFIPSGVDVMTGSSTTLNEIGFVDLLKSGRHPWNNLKDKISFRERPQKAS